MPVRSDAEDDGITKLGSVDFTDKAIFRERDVPDGLEREGHILDKFQLLTIRYARIDGIGN